MTSVSKNVCIVKLDDIINKYNNISHEIQNKSVDVSNAYINYSEEINGKDPKFKIDDIDKISKYKNIFAKGCLVNWSEKVL